MFAYLLLTWQRCSRSTVLSKHSRYLLRCSSSHQPAPAQAPATTSKAGAVTQTGKNSDSRPVLHHLHIPFNPPCPFPPAGNAKQQATEQATVWTYAQAAALQERIARRILDWKARRDSTSASNNCDGDTSSATLSLPSSPPPPTVITFTPHPTYTFGLRQTAESAAPPVVLTSPLLLQCAASTSKHATAATLSLRPHTVATYRGGQTTYHGPGQLVCWAMVDLRSRGLRLQSDWDVSSSSETEASPITGIELKTLTGVGAGIGAVEAGSGGGVTLEKKQQQLGPRVWAHLLESVTVQLLAERYGIDCMTTPENPGVWARGVLSPLNSVTRDKLEVGVSDADNATAPEASATSSPPRKIASMGVQHRRYVTALGIAINLSQPANVVTHVPEKELQKLEMKMVGQASLGEAADSNVGASSVANKSVTPPSVSAADEKRVLYEPWSRFVACGNTGRSVTSVVAELKENGAAVSEQQRQRLRKLQAGIGTPEEREEMLEVARDWVSRLSAALGLSVVEQEVGAEVMDGEGIPGEDYFKFDARVNTFESNHDTTSDAGVP